MVKIAPSILSSDFARLIEAIRLLEKNQADYVHIDVMDGHFVPNITIGMPVIESLRKTTDLTFDVHLMIDNADRYVLDFKRAGSDILTVHYENTIHLDRTIHHIKENFMKAGVAIVPTTPPEALEYILKEVDMVTVMSVNPGFGGQKFIEASLEKIRRLKEMREEKGYTFEIEVDGGVDQSNYLDIIEAGADVLVAGSAVFKSKDPAKTIRLLKGN